MSINAQQIKLLFLFLIALQFSCTKTTKQEFFLQKGDLLFQDLDSSPICKAIEEVTPGYMNSNFSHIGIVVETGDSNYIAPDYRYDEHVKIIEAWPGGVREISIDSFLQRSFDNNNDPKVIAGRLKKKYRHTIKDGVKFVQNEIGSDYDDAFIINNNSYYCSELIYEAFEKHSIFNLNPMNFSDPKTKKPLKEWEKYYLDLGVAIPQDEPGINPGIMSLSEKIQIVYHYGLASKNKN